MKFFYTYAFRKSILGFPKAIRAVFYKQAAYLLQDIRHPSLRAKKYDETRGIWQARVNRTVRFYFIIEGENYVLLDIKKHSD